MMTMQGMIIIMLIRHHFIHFLGYSTEGNVGEAFRMLNLMISKEILPNSFTLTALMKTCVTKGDWESARELLCIGAKNFYNSRNTSSYSQPIISI